MNWQLKILILYVFLCPKGNNLYGCHSIESEINPKSTLIKFNSQDCDNVEGFTQDLRKEIQTYAPVINNIANLVLNGTEKGVAYDELALFVDTFGPRPSGSDSLEKSIDYMLKKFNTSNFENVHGESAFVPKWERGNEWAIITEPVNHKMEILALGTSVGTEGLQIKAEVVVVNSFEELDTLGKAGMLDTKIVIYNAKFTTYAESVKFRSSGAVRAAPYGAVAALVRSVTPFSIYSPHTGQTSYDDNLPKIPTAAITLEDADYIARWVKRGKRVVVKLYMEAKNYPDVESRNVIGELVGSQLPEQVVLISGHIDSWDITQGEFFAKLFTLLLNASRLMILTFSIVFRLFLIKKKQQQYQQAQWTTAAE